MRFVQGVAVGGLVVFASLVQAQPFGMGGERPFERIEQWKKVRMIEMLDLKEEQSIRFFARLNEHESAKRELMKQRDEALDKIERLVRNHADDKEFEKVFPDVIAVNKKLGEENLRFFNGVSDILSTEQRGRLLLFERNFERELREAMKEARRHRRGEEP